MRRVLLVLLAGFALLAIGAGASPALAATFTQDGKTFSSDEPVYSNPLEPLPSGAQAAPDRKLPQDNTPAFVLLGGVALALIAALVLWLAMRLLALEPRWITNGRHAVSEAGWRATNTWDEFKDWIRLGR